MNFKPLHDYVLVERIPSPTTSKGGIVLTARDEKSNLCKVLAVGTEEVYDEIGDDFVTKPTVPVKVGDTVLIGKHAGHEIKWNDKDCVVLKGDEILGILEEDVQEIKPCAAPCSNDTDGDGNCPSCAHRGGMP